MKAADFSNHLTKALTMLLIIILLSGSVTKGQNVSTESKKYKRMIENLIAGIQSENEGAKRDCIYFAGRYEIVEAVDALIDLLKQEKNSKNKVLIALALYKIGNDRGIQAVYEASLSESDAKVKHTFINIVSEYKAAKTFAVIK